MLFEAWPHILLIHKLLFLCVLQTMDFRVLLSTIFDFSSFFSLFGI